MSAFPEAGNEIVAQLAIDLLSEQAALLIIALIAEINGSVVGHIAFSPVIIDSNKACKAYILAPLAVKPVCQKQGVGSTLV